MDRFKRMLSSESVKPMAPRSSTTKRLNVMKRGPSIPTGIDETADAPLTENQNLDAIPDEDLTGPPRTAPQTPGANPTTPANANLLAVPGIMMKITRKKDHDDRGHDEHSELGDLVSAVSATIRKLRKPMTPGRVIWRTSWWT
eukprot:g7722.t1